jgi:Zn-dependent protease with chaperone function
MTVSTITPLVLALMLAMAVTALHRRLPPALATRAIATTLVVVVGAAIPTMWLTAFAFVAHSPVSGGEFAWCAHALGMHDQVPVALGVVAGFVAVVGTVRAVRAIRSNRLLRQDHPGSVEVLGHDQPFAFTLPGRGGHIIVSSGLTRLLDETEQRIVLAHESAHARHRHDRYILVANVASSAIPLLRPLAARLKYSLERWADEAAARSCGDRTMVARTLGRVALGQFATAGVAAFAGLGVPARVAALLAPPVRRPHRSIVAAIWLAIATTALLSLFQIHHLSALLTALCPD